MRAIIPIAGKGERLHPLTHYKPKVLVEVAGKPVLEHILDNLVHSGIRDVLLIVGHMKEEIRSWTLQKYRDRLDINFNSQEQQLGLGHAIRCADEYLSDEILIMLGDEIFENKYSEMVRHYVDSNSGDGALGTKHVTEPQHYGMLRVDGKGVIQELVEKPPEFDGNLGIAGLYYIKDGHSLKEALDVLMERERKLGEFQLTDALQIMVENGARFSTFDVGNWYDCGRFETLMVSNQKLLKRYNLIDESSHIKHTKIIEPCYIGPGAEISDSTLGPFVAVGVNATIDNSQLEDVILESHSSTHGVSGRRGVISRHTAVFESSNGVFTEYES